ncbi:MAG: hypothetical protein ABWY93_09280 [Mycobacterium sp.]
MAVADRVARLAMIGSPDDGGQTLDQYELDLSDDSTAELAATIVDTHRALAASGNRLAATRLSFTEASEAAAFRQVLLDAGLIDVDVLSESEAAAALIRTTDAGAFLLVDDDTVTLNTVDADPTTTSIVASADIGAAGAVVACAWVLQRLGESATTGPVLLVGQRDDLDSIAAGIHERSPFPVEVPADPSFAIARGAAKAVTLDMTAPPTQWGLIDPAGPATQLAPSVGGEATALAPVVAPAAAGDATAMGAVLGPQLAYSMADDDPLEMPMGPLGELIPEHDDEETFYTQAIEPVRPRMLLMGSVIAFAAVGLGILGVTVAINIRPAASVSQQPTPALQSETVPGRYLPQVPHQPDPDAKPVVVLTPPPAAPPVVSPRTDNAPVIRDAPVAPPPVNAPPPPPVNIPAPPPAVPPPVGVPVIPLPPIIILPPIQVTTPPWTPPPWTPPTTPTRPPTTPPTTPTTTPPTTPTTTPPTTPTTTPTTTPPTTPTTTEAPTTPTTEAPTTPTTTEAPPTTPTTEAPTEPSRPEPATEPKPVPEPASTPAPAVETPAPAATEAPAPREPAVEAPATTVVTAPS